MAAGPFRVPRPAGALPARLEVGVRPEHVQLGDEGERGEVVAVEPLGAETHVVVRVGDLDLCVRTLGFEVPRRGGTVRVSIDASHALVFDADGQGERVI
jgi:multiple sugar transport system ATP-binding protein